MADNKVTPSNGIFSLGGTKHAEISGLDTSQYDVFTTDKNLADAQAKFSHIDWFTCFSVKDKSGNPADVNYTLTFDGPAAGTLYYYLNGNIHPVPHNPAASRGSQARVQASLNVGDPPVGM